MPLPPIAIRGDIMFWGCPSMSANVHPSVHESVWACIQKCLLARYLTNQWTSGISPNVGEKDCCDACHKTSAYFFTSHAVLLCASSLLLKIACKHFHAFARQ